MDITYGTSGYRGPAHLLPEIIKRTAYFAGKRARGTNRTIGLMLTASHNPPQDNGVKVIDYHGGMLSTEWEEMLDNFVGGGELLDQIYEELDDRFNARVVIGTDTRDSATFLVAAAMEGLRLAAVPAIVFYNHTTPILHYVVQKTNIRSSDCPMGYVSRIRNGFRGLLDMTEQIDINRELYVDCANGVGTFWIRKVLFSEEFVLHLCNTEVERPEYLNTLCGADHVKITRTLPQLMLDVEINTRCASLDGDADRLVYFYRSSTWELILLDGDHIAALFGIFLHEQLTKLRTLTDPNFSFHDFTFGVVQTAYSNGNSTRFFRERLGIVPDIAKTGVKNLERLARKYDIGIYFEANGHGTVCFSEDFKDYLKRNKKLIVNLNHDIYVPNCVRRLYYFTHIVNEVVGDGIADLVAVEALLRYYGWNITDWHYKTFTSLPSIQTKIKVKDRRMFCCSDESETILVKPLGLQATIDKIVEKFDNARAFIRPSGTESIVRIFTEASTMADATALTEELKEVLKSFSLD